MTSQCRTKYKRIIKTKTAHSPEYIRFRKKIELMSKIDIKYSSQLHKTVHCTTS